MSFKGLATLFGLYGRLLSLGLFSKVSHVIVTNHNHKVLVKLNCGFESTIYKGVTCVPDDINVLSLRFMNILDKV